MPKSILPLLVCPITKQNLYLITGDKAEVLAQALDNGEIRYLDGSVLNIESDRVQFLITENAHHVYSIIDGVPVLLESMQIDMSPELRN